jgi:hypothetical protein
LPEVVVDSAVAELEAESDAATAQALGMAVELGAALMGLVQELGSTPATPESSRMVLTNWHRHPEVPMALPPKEIPKQESP